MSPAGIDTVGYSETFTGACAFLGTGERYPIYRDNNPDSSIAAQQ
jgi:hypothetical protein